MQKKNLKNLNKNKILFLDRDGVINFDKGYLYKYEDLEYIPGIFDLCLYLTKKLKFKIIIITNQSGIGRGYYSLSDFNTLNNWMMKEFQKNGIIINSVYYCPHVTSDNCKCRKPKTKMIDDICGINIIDKTKSWVIGDKVTDIELANNSGIQNTVFVSNYSEINFNKKPNLIASDINYILKNKNIF